MNGRIEATTQRFSLDGTQRFAVLVPKAAFHGGRNDVDIYSVNAETPLLLTRQGAIGGWAVDIRDRAPADRILVFSGDRLVFEGTTDLLRWELEGTRGYRDLERSGWIAELPFLALDRSDVKAFAVRGNVASELVRSVPGGRLSPTASSDS